MVPEAGLRRAAFDPIDWPLAEKVARRVAGKEQLAASYLGVSLATTSRRSPPRRRLLVAEHTGLRPPGAARAGGRGPRCLGRGERGLDARMLAPLTVRIGARMAASPIAPIGRTIAGTETGVLLGYLAQRVLGQYDLLVPERRRSRADAVYYVGGNVLGLEKRFAFRPHDFRLWIAIHEVTHRAQFTAVPWMKPYYLSLVEQSLLSGGS